MRTFDFTPLYRSTVGFDRLADLIGTVTGNDVSGASYPPFNIVKKSDDAYRISIAVAGLSEKDLKVEVHQNQLLVTAKKSDEGNGVEYLHRGIAERGFARKFYLADHIVVVGAAVQDGMLHIDLKREIPEALKPRTIEINRIDQGPAVLEA